MKLSLSTNWCNRRCESGEEIVDKAIELGFSELELGYHTTLFQVKGFKQRLDEMPVGSVHAFCPVPISAPQGYPELYQLASFDEEDRKMAKLMIGRNIRFAAEMGADTVVLHAGRVGFGTFFDRLDTQKLKELFRDGDHKTDDRKFAKAFARASKRRLRRGAKLMDAFKRELGELVPVLEKCNVTLALENLPYYEGFPNDGELMQLVSHFQHAPIRGWFDTGHARVCEMNGWGRTDFVDQKTCARDVYAGMHLNDVEAFEDDHFSPGMGKVDFASLKTFAENVKHVVFEPNAGVKEAELRDGVEHIRKIWHV